MRIHTLQTELWMPRPLEEVFAFFSDAANLEELTPPWLNFPIRWRTEITVWEPPFRFVDRQIKGPYRQWIHEHTFEAKDGGTLMRDRVDYAVPGWILEPLVHAWVVGPDVQRIFAYREQQMRRRFGPPVETAPTA
ncbi:MAG: SRPBCC family protein [Gemmataceae bacterium]